MLRRHVLILAGMAPLLLPSPDLSAQAVRGRLLDASSAEPVAGALVVLLDADGSELVSTVTSARGTYHLRAPGAGQFRLRAERIGFENSLSGAFTLLAGETATEELTASSSAIVLPVLSVESESECRVRPEEGYATYALWEEARKALEITERTATAYRFDAVTYQRHVNLWGEPLEPGDNQFVSYAGRHPWRSVPIDELREHGYAREAREGTYYYGPDAEVLLSDQFLDSHCFRYRLGDDDQVLGLAFEPVRWDSDRVDVEGVLWLQRESAQLKTLEFRYTGVPRPTNLGTGPGPYGQIVFDQLPGGGWIVREWWIRTPTGSRQRGVQTYVTYAQQGGRVNHTEKLGASPADMRPVPSVYGPTPSTDSTGTP
jgi:hypothetical protein